MVTTSVYDSPSLHRLAVQDTTERVQPTAYMIESAGHHALVPNYYCVVSDGGVYKVRFVCTVNRRTARHKHSTHSRADAHRHTHIRT